MPICLSTQERNPTVEKVIGRASVILLIWMFIAEFTLEGNHTNVGIVVNALVVAQIFIPIRQLALKRNHTSVMSVGSASFWVLIFSYPPLPPLATNLATQKVKDWPLQMKLSLSQRLEQNDNPVISFPSQQKVIDMLTPNLPTVISVFQASWVQYSSRLESIYNFQKESKQCGNSAQSSNCKVLARILL